MRPHVEPRSAHHLFPGSIGTSSAPLSTRGLFFSFTRSVSAILSLYAFILAFPVKILFNDLAIGRKDLEMVQLRACTIRTIITTLECQCPCGCHSVCRQAKAHPPALLSSLLMCNSICAFRRGSSRADRPQRGAHGGRVQPDTVVPHSR